MNWYLKVLREYANFNGRARRTEYWMFSLFIFISYIVLSIISGVLNNVFGTDIFAGLIVLYMLFIIVPSIAVVVRRLHDVGKSGWFLLIGIIPLIGSIWIFVLSVTDSDHGPNEYGDNPKGIGNSNAIDQIGEN